MLQPANKSDRMCQGKFPETMLMLFCAYVMSMFRICALQKTVMTDESFRLHLKSKAQRSASVADARESACLSGVACRCLQPHVLNHHPTQQQDFAPTYLQASFRLLQQKSHIAQTWRTLLVALLASTTPIARSGNRFRSWWPS